MLRTPMADEAGGGPLHPDVAAERGQTLRLSGQILAITGNLRPPVVFDMPDTMPDAPNKGSHRKSQPAGLGNQIAELLPTPQAHDARGGKTPEQVAAAKAKSSAGFSNLNEVTDWGRYEPAIRSHELLVGRPAPEPTQLSKTGKPQLSPRFTEWMMGWPEGWVTECGLSRNEALRACGNGVVPQQAAWAVRECLKGKGDNNE